MSIETFAVLTLAGIGGLLLFSKSTRAETMKETSKPNNDGLTRGERNNNPGNIRFDSRWTWQGQKGADSAGYLIFDTPENGIRAMAKDLLSKYARGLDTVAEIIAVYAPPSENPTSTYAAKVAGDMGVTVAKQLNLTDKATLTNMVMAMIRFENGRVNFSGAVIQEGVRRALS